MLHLCGRKLRLCDGLSRREFLRAGSLALGGLTLPELLRADAANRKTHFKRVIQLFLWGGPSQHETFDLKPHAPDGVRGAFRPIATRTPGLRICEHLPRLAQRSDQYAIVRSVTHTGTNHGTSAYHMLTGRIHFTPGTLRHPTPNDHPSVNAAVNRFARPSRGMPTTVSLPSVLYDGDGGEVPGQGPGLLGQRCTPFMVNGDPTRRDFSIQTLKLPADMDGGRLRRRIDLQAALDREGERLAHLPAARAMDDYHDKAFRLLQSPQARRAFSLSAEPAGVRERYGLHHFGQSCLLARRLIEADVRLVTVYWNAPTNADNQSWDTHTNSFERLKNYLLPAYDQAVSALLDDLHARGLLAETLVLSMGEFGRTPKINKQAGRDHWGFCQSILAAGGGVHGGQVYGSSDASAAYAAELPVSPDDLAATVLHGLGISADREIRDGQGRPLPLCNGKPVLGLF
ncbi:MAG TPA: DUF1501 domain-containing protein [Gemmataceae bacterium]|jgi:hypothetical protein